MTEAAWIKLFESIPGYISGFTALVMAFVAYRQLERNATQKAATLEVAQKVEQVIQTTDKIKTATDGGLTDVKEQLKSVTEQNKTITEQNASLQGTVKVLSDAMATRTNNAKRETGELIAVEAKNGDTVTRLLEEVAKLNERMAGFAKDGMPVVAPDGAPLPVVPVKASEVKK